MADTLRDALNGTGSDYLDSIQVEPRLVLPSTGVSVSVVPANPPRESTMAGIGDLGGAYLIDVVARANVADSDATQDILIDMLDDLHPLSVAAALDADQDLNGYATLVEFDPDASQGLGIFQMPDGPPFVGCSWRFKVGEASS